MTVIRYALLGLAAAGTGRFLSGLAVAVAAWLLFTVCRTPRPAPGTQLRYEFRMWRLDIRCRLRRRPVRAADGRPLDADEQEAFGLIEWEYPVLSAAEPQPRERRES